MAILAALLVLGLSQVPTVWAAPSGTTRYIDNRISSGCDDAGPGTAPDAPWCTFTPANATTFGPGDQLLLARGASWNQELTITGSGSQAAPFVLGAYGQGDRPVIGRNEETLDRGVYLDNPSHVVVRDLEVKDASVGIEAYYDTLGHENLTFDNIFVHNMAGIHETNAPQGAFSDPIPRCWADPSAHGEDGGNLYTNTLDGIWESAGIVITGPSNLKFLSTEYALKGLVVSNVEGTHNQQSFSVDFCNGAVDTDGPDWTGGSSLIQDVTLTHLYFHDDDGGYSLGGDNEARAKSCPNSLRFINMSNATLTDSVIDAGAACYTDHGTAGIMIGRVDNATISDNLFINLPVTGSPDQTGIDFECCNNNVTIRNNMFRNIAGPAIEVMAIHGPDDHNTNISINDNLFIDNGSKTPGYTGTVTRTGGDMTPTGEILNNTYIAPTGFLGYHGGDFEGFIVDGNEAVDTGPWQPLVRYVRPGIGRIVQVGTPPPGFEAEETLGLVYVTAEEPPADMVGLYNCRIGETNDYFLSTNAACEGQNIVAFQGYIYPSPQDPPPAGTVPFRRCLYLGVGHYATAGETCVSPDPNAIDEFELGYLMSSDLVSSPDFTAPWTFARVEGVSGVGAWYPGPAHVILTAVDDLDEAPAVEYNLDNTGWMTYGRATPPVVVAEGAHTLAYRASDGENVSEPEEIQVNIDTTAPVITWVGGPAEGATYPTTGVPAQPTCTADDGAGSQVEGSCTVTGYGDAVGSYTLVATATDRVGNVQISTRAYTVRAAGTDASLKTLTVNGQALPEFAMAGPQRLEFAVEVGHGVDLVTLEATPTDPNAQVSGDLGQQAVTVGSDNKFEITVTAEDGKTKEAHWLTVTRADDSALVAALVEAAGLSADSWTPESWDVFEAARSNAEAVMNDPSSLQASIDAAVDALSQSRAALVAVAAEPEPPLATTGARTSLTITLAGALALILGGLVLLRSEQLRRRA
jgi:hypothetical protein